MKKRTLFKLMTVALTFVGITAVQAQFVGPAPLVVPGNNYAFAYSPSGTVGGLTPFGLYFKATGAEPGFEYRGAGGDKLLTVQSIASGNREPGDVTFGNTGSLIIGPNRYAFRFSLTNTYGLFFNAADFDYEFRTADASSIFSIGAVSGDVRTDGDIGVGTFTPAYRVDVQGSPSSTQGLIYATVNHSVSTDTRAVYGTSVPAPGYGVGVQGVAGYVGVWGTNNGSTYTGSSWGGYFTSSGSAGTRYGLWGSSSNSGGTNAYGVYGSASGATNNWAGYFPSGNTHVGDQLAVGTTSPGTDYKVDIQGGIGSIRALNVNNTYTGTAVKYGIYSNLDAGGTGSRYGIYSNVTGNAADPSASYGMRSLVSTNGSAASGYGVYSSITTSGTGNKYALYGFASTIDPSPTTRSWALYASGNSYFSGDVRMGFISDVPGYKLAVNGDVICEELRVQDSGSWPDYVFDEDYDLIPLDDLKKHVTSKKHLPGIPTAEVVDAEGFDVGKMQTRMMEKIEELTLYIIEQNDRLKVQEEKIQNMQEQLNRAE